MFAKFIEAIKSLFSSLFGGSKTTTPTDKPSPPKPQPTDKMPPQDAIEMPTDTLIIVSNENDTILVPPSAPNEDLDEDVLDETAPPTQPETPATPAQSVKKQRYLWCLDNGHGKKTPGKRSPVFEFEGKEDRLFEYLFNRDIVRQMIERLEKEGVAFYNVVPEVDIDDFLQGRVDRANKKQSSLPKLYVSIHSNASRADNQDSWGADSAKGIETWHHANSRKGTKMAAIFQQHLIAKTGFKNRHLKTTEETNLFVLRKTNMPAILTENGFYNNRLEAIELMKDKVRQQIADAHVEAILEIERDGL